MPRIVVIGAGICGLATAFHLKESLPGAEIAVFEAAARPGGTIWTERRDGFQVELGANGFLDNKPSTLHLCRRLGLADQLRPASDAAKDRFLFWNDRLQPLPSSLLSFARTPLLSFRGKLSLLLERFRPRRIDTPDESVHDFVCRRGGAEAGLFADALVTGIHAGDPRLLSMRAAFPRIVAWEEKYGSVTAGLKQAAKERRAEAAARGEPYRPGSRLWSFRQGLRVLIERLGERLGDYLHFGVRCQSIEKTPDGWIVVSEDGGRWSADAVVLACPAHQQATLLAGCDSQLSAEMAAIAYSPAAVVALGFRKEEVPGSLDGFGYIVPQQLRRDILGVQWCSSIFPGRAPTGAVLLRAMAGGWHRGEVVTWHDDRLLHAVRRELQLAMKISAEPIFHHIVRWPSAIPQYHLGHLDRVAHIETVVGQHSGLFVTGNAYHGVALNDCTEQAERVAASVGRFLTRR